LSLDKDAPLTRAIHPQKWAESLNCHRWEDFTIDTNDGQLSQSLPL
jgi:hypothetical protein